MPGRINFSHLTAIGEHTPVSDEPINALSPESAVDALTGSGKVPPSVWRYLLCGLNESSKEQLASMARLTSQKHFGNGVYVRALIEISSWCRNNCNYCGLRSSNTLACRYRLTKEEILQCCSHAATLGFNTFVLQGGEDPVQNDAWLASVVSDIKNHFPHKAITLSVGERTPQGYALLRSAGADRYLLRHETATQEHYAHLHPHTMSLSNRLRCLATLKELGYQVGSGFMVGSPGQGTEHLIADLMLLDELQPQMIGIGPFIPASGTPFADEKPGSIEDTLLLISLLRLRFPRALIPATTALATLCTNGTERGILAGANVVMPNITPLHVRDKYTIYNKKKSSGSESATQLSLLESKLSAIGYHIDYSRGDYPIIPHSNV